MLSWCRPGADGVMEGREADDLAGEGGGDGLISNCRYPSGESPIS